eukprot:12258956-Ditylum_brightwellii.AAC.1
MDGENIAAGINEAGKNVAERKESDNIKVSSSLMPHGNGTTDKSKTSVPSASDDDEDDQTKQNKTTASTPLEPAIAQA